MATFVSEPVAYAFQTEAGGWRVTGSRVSLDSVVHMYHEGADPETIVRQFPSLSLEQAYGAIAFYLRNRQAIDAYLEEQRKRWETLRRESAERNRDLREKIRQRAQQQTSGESQE